MVLTNGRYSKYIRPITYFIDVLIILILNITMLPTAFQNTFFLVFIWLCWTIIAININFYNVYRFTKISSIFYKTIKQFIFFTIFCTAFSSFYFVSVYSKSIIIYSSYCIFLIMIFKFSIFYFLKKYRAIFKGNLRSVVIFGKNSQSENLAQFFLEYTEIGYDLKKVFDFDENNKKQCEFFFNYVLENSIDEIYCAFSKFDFNKLNLFAEFADNNRKALKYIPLSDELLSTNLKINFYGYIPIASVREIPQAEYVNVFIKRAFDILFSLVVILFLLSWLVPLLAILIKIESDGSVFFRQGRPGLDEKQFFCYKFRSMQINITTEKEASKNDPRVTKIGRFMRKTSLDEMPQFLNVLLGDMSVVGPRPHLWSQNKAYGRKISKYMVRHFVKPGVTGLAQVKGYRGEIETDEDMINRINFDVYYIENWSVILDIKIIVQTVINIFKGDDKAY